MKAKTNIARAKGIFVLAMAMIIAFMTGCGSKKNDPKPTPPPAGINISLLQGSAWTTTSVITYDANGSVVSTITDKNTINNDLLLPQPDFTSSTTGLEEVSQANFPWSYTAATSTLVVTFDSQDIVTATITKLDANNLTLHEVGSANANGIKGYAAIDQILTR